MKLRSIEATGTARAPFPYVKQTLLTDPAAAFTGAATVEERRTGAFRCLLSVAVGSATAIREDVVLTIGVPRIGDVVTVPLSWMPEGLRRVVPSFSGELVAADDASLGGGTLVSLAGAYSLPIGGLGRVADAVFWGRFAEKSLASFLGGVTQRLDREFTRAGVATPWRPAAEAPIDLRDTPPSELYLG